MKNSNLSPELKEVITNQGGICASMIIPVHHIPREKQTDRINLSHAATKLRTMFNEMNHPESKLLEKAEKLITEAKEISGQHAVGIFVSENTAKITTFPFDVKEKVIVGDTFEIRDLVQKERYLKEHHVLILGGQFTRLFLAKENQFTEINDKNFPISFDGVDYEIPVQINQGNNASQTMKREKATTTQSMESFYKTMDKKLNDYLKNDACLIVAGVEKELSHFYNYTAHQAKIKGKIFGSYDNNTISILQHRVAEAYQNIIKEEDEQYIKRLREMGREFVSSGIRDVWFDVKQGKGNILLVEKDLEQKGYIDQEGFVLALEPTGNNLHPVPDAVDDVIENMLQRDGKVVFVENGCLKEYGGVAMINRY